MLYRSAGDSSEGGGGDAVLQSNVEDDLAAMGFAAPVTKEQAGRRYHKELARQVRTRKCHRASNPVLRSAHLDECSWHASERASRHRYS